MISVPQRAVGEPGRLRRSPWCHDRFTGRSADRWVGYAPFMRSRLRISYSCTSA
jgi:hypothetical protein